MKKKIKKSYDIFLYDLDGESSNVTSSTECTGLIQIPPDNEEESKSYGDLYAIPEQVNDYKFVKKAKGRHIKSAP